MNGFTSIAKSTRDTSKEYLISEGAANSLRGKG